jgi:Predicted nucleic acid-binding protein, contains PIN domain
MKYLLDTNICIAILRGNRTVIEKAETAGFFQCAISEITKAELLYGACRAKEEFRERELKRTVDFLDAIEVLPISESLLIFALEKTRLGGLGIPIDDFDLLIGSTAVQNDLVLVTDNLSHLGRMPGIRMENWASH